jgi:hypothetical protein
VLGEVGFDLGDDLGVVGALSSSQKMAGVLVRRARLTASFTQSCTGASLVWQARQMSPSSTACSRRTLPVSSTTRMVPAPGDLEGLVVRAVFLGGLGHEADVGDGAHGLRVEGAVFFAEVDRGLVDAGVAAVGNDAEGVLLLAGGVPHLPEVRIIAGMEASTMTSLGTWRLVMPWSELTMAMAGPAA